MAAATFRFAGRDWPADIVAEIGHIGSDGKPTGRTRKHVVTTAPDGRVLITTPSLTAMCFMTCGGGRWHDELQHEPPGFLERQIAEQAKHGVGEWAARRFVLAMQRGGCSVDEAYDIVRDRFCAHLGTGRELWDTADVPTDRTYRDAWRRSHNGGPLYVHVPAARRIQWQRIKKAVEAHNRPRLALGRKPIVPPWSELGNAIRHARDEEELRRVWPTGLGHVVNFELLSRDGNDSGKVDHPEYRTI